MIETSGMDDTILLRGARIVLPDGFVE